MFRFPLPLLRPLFPALVLLLLTGCSPRTPDEAAPPSADPGPFQASVLPNGFTFPPHDTVRVMTWNLENFVDLHDNPYNDSESESRPDRREMQERHETLAAFLRAIRPDVVAFQEVEGVALMEELAERFFPELGYRFFAAADRGDWHHNVFVMSRLPLGVVRTLAPLTTPVPGTLLDSGETEAQNQVNHRILVVEVMARPGAWFTLAAAHLKAGRTPRDEGHRRGQLEALQAELARTQVLYPGIPTLVAGDLNLVPSEAELQVLTDGSGSLRFRDVLGPGGLPTHPSEEPVRQLDYILVNPAMAERLIPGSGRVGAPFPVDALRLMSDHLPVTADFLFPGG